MKNIFKIIQVSKPLHHLVAILGVLILGSTVLNLIAPILSKFIVDDIVSRLQHKGGNMNHLIFLIVASFIANFLGIAVSSISDRIGDHFAGRLKKFLIETFYFKVLSLPQSYFDSQISGKIMSQLSRGIATIYEFMNMTSNFMLPTFMQSIFIVGVLAYYNLPIALFTFALFPIYLILSYYSTVRWGKEEVKKNAIEDYFKGRMGEVISNISLVKSFNTEKMEYKTVEENLTKSNVIYARQSKTYHIFDFARQFSLIGILFAISILVFYNTFIGKLSIGEMVLILQLFNQARIPLFAMSFILTRIQQAEAGSKEYFEIIGLPSVEEFRETYDKTHVADPTITFKNVSFKYEQSEKVLDGVSFEMKKHEKVALVGHSGAGKSTIVNLILKFYDPTSGDMYLKDANYKDLSHRFVRNNIALVFQESELFSTSVRENVAYGKASASEKDIIEALKGANAWEFVQKLPKGLDSEVGERGLRLSGGQKQRIQIARAILKDAPILILDEATSSLDAKSEKEVQEALERLMKKRLVVIIAHRFSTIQNVDKVIVIENGVIANYGTPRELSRQKGIYSELLHYQIGGNKKLLESFELY